MNRKRKFHLTCAIAAPFAAAFILGACTHKSATGSSAPAGDADSISVNAQLITDSIAWNDSIASPGGCKAFCSISVAYPVNGPAAAVDSIRGWISRQLATYNYITADTSAQAPFAVNPSLRSDGARLIAATGRKVLAAALPDLQSLDSLKIDPPLSMSYSWNITRMFTTDSIATFGNATYVYLGGAHGGSSFNARTFRLSDGTSLGWNMFPQSELANLLPLVKEGIKTQYFHASTDSEFKDMLLLTPGAGFPLPASQPYFMADGIHFDYQQYEIAPYAAGMPSCVLPYSKVRPLLTPQAASLIPE